ncbi:zinc ribbon domain-containing protein, partial [Streptomyces sp. NPDC059378]|uniref:zinc ribbon domain-containing protein n=1 Tax=Streptomyces sp. NPDC059378 TaxID=3346815 RepID=UPI0036B6FF52
VAPASAHTARPTPPPDAAWPCRACGAVLDRDVNAAVNVAKAAGLAVSACRAQVRRASMPAQRGEAGTHPKQPTRRVREQAGIPDLQAREDVNARNSRPLPRATARS